MSKIATVLDHFDRNGGPGASLPTGDVEILREYLIEKLTATGVPVDEAYKIVQVMYWGSWSEGWEAGYASAAEYHSHSRRFSLTTEGYGSQEFRDEIQKSEA